MSLAERLNRHEATRGETGGYEMTLREVPAEAPAPAVDPRREQQNVIAERVRRSVIDKLHDKSAEPNEKDVQNAIEEIDLLAAGDDGTAAAAGAANGAGNTARSCHCFAACALTSRSRFTERPSTARSGRSSSGAVRCFNRALPSALW